MLFGYWPWGFVECVAIQCSGVFPNESVALGSTAWSKHHWASSTNPCSAAWWSGVIPDQSAAAEGLFWSYIQNRGICFHCSDASSDCCDVTRGGYGSWSGGCRVSVECSTRLSYSKCWNHCQSDEALDSTVVSTLVVMSSENTSSPSSCGLSSSGTSFTSFNLAGLPKRSGFLCWSFFRLELLPFICFNASK